MYVLILKKVHLWSYKNKTFGFLGFWLTDL